MFYLSENSPKIFFIFGSEGDRCQKKGHIPMLDENLCQKDCKIFFEELNRNQRLKLGKLAIPKAYLYCEYRSQRSKMFRQE